MKSTVPELNLYGHQLMAVPAVHYRAAFAAHVRSVFSSETSRPTVVAVELGSGVSAAISTWLKELEIPASGSNLPIMLGLIHQNRRIHPRFKAKAIRLQQHYGRPLHEIPPPILQEHLCFSAVSLACLSPTDSIIEAIRSAIEFEIPVYGIDLDDSAAVETMPCIVEDPLKAFGNLEGYIERNQHAAMEQRDQHVDGRRERVMAARLKFLLQQHERVLFTGGLAHWLEIQRLLMDPSFPAALIFNNEHANEIIRVLVHPSIAIAQMDLFPNVTTWYEKERHPAAECHPKADRVEFLKMYREHLNTAYSSYFSEQGTEGHAVEKLKDLEKLSAFECYIGNLSILSGQQQPHLFTLLEAARATMSTHFTDSLTVSLLRHGIRWALPKDFPDLPVIGPARRIEGKASYAGIHSARLGVPSKRRNGGDGCNFSYTDSFYYESLSEFGNSSLDVKASWFPFDEPTISISNGWGLALDVWVWPPCEFLLHGTAYEAANIAKADTHICKTEAFGGSLLDGIDIKATLRARSRGDQALYVHSKKMTVVADNAVAQGETLDPTVFIFEDPSEKTQAEWHLGAAGNSILREYFETAAQRVRFDEAVKEYGPLIIGSVSFSRAIDVSDSLKAMVESAHELIGIITFGNPCAHVKQSVMWLNAIGYASCPIIRSMDFNTLLEFFRLRHNLSINPLDWSTTLIRFAIPYARNRVIIVADKKFIIDPICRKEAQMRQVQLSLVPLSAWPRERVHQMRRQYSVRAGNGGLHYEKKLELKLGPKDRYLDLLPQAMQAQVHANR